MEKVKQQYSFFYTDASLKGEIFEKIIASEDKQNAQNEFNKFLLFLAQSGRIVHETTK